jgi:DNA-binding NtrC family response regulator
MSATTKRILIVDDQRPMLAILSEHFKAKYAVETAINTGEALAIVRRGRPDLVLLDITMPGRSGLQALREILKMDPSISVVMVTGSLNADIEAEAMQSGAVAYVQKPFDLRDLDRVVAEILANRL